MYSTNHRLKSLRIPPITDSNHCVFHQSQTQIIVHSTNHRLKSLSIPPITDSNYCAFHQSQTQLIVDSTNHRLRSLCIPQINTVQGGGRTKSLWEGSYIGLGHKAERTLHSLCLPRTGGSAYGTTHCGVN